jgi:hypothetical protein
MLAIEWNSEEHVILAFNSFNAKEIYESWFIEEERRLEVKICRMSCVLRHGITIKHLICKIRHRCI